MSPEMSAWYVVGSLLMRMISALRPFLSKKPTHGRQRPEKNGGEKRHADANPLLAKAEGGHPPSITTIKAKTLETAMGFMAPPQFSLLLAPALSSELTAGVQGRFYGPGVAVEFIFGGGLTCARQKLKVKHLHQYTAF